MSPRVARVIADAYREFFIAVAGATGALIGLLFVAVSVAGERVTATETRAEFGSRASAALLLFTNALVLSLVGLIPGSSIGWWAISISIIVLVFAVATARLIVEVARQDRGHWRSLGLVVALVAVAGVEMYGGILRLRDPGGVSGLRTLQYLMVAELLVGIARAWQLVGLRDTGIFASLRILARGGESGESNRT